MPTVFISYSWDNQAHKAWVADLGARLRGDGIDAKLDQWHANLGIQYPEFMERQIRENDFVLIVCTPEYKRKSDGRLGGVGYEGDIMTGELLTRNNNMKFIPILRYGDWKDAAPTWAGGKRYVDFSDPSKFDEEYHELRNTLIGRPPPPPPLAPLSLLQENIGQTGAQLSKEEIDILVASHTRGQLILMQASMFGTWLRADETDFADETNNDPAVQAVYLEALDLLLSRGFVRMESPKHFVLTGTGFSYARRLARLRSGSEALTSATDYRHICRNGFGAEVLVELPRVAYVGEIQRDYNFYVFSVIYQANQAKIDIGGFSNRALAETEKSKLEIAFQAWANRPL